MTDTVYSSGYEDWVAYSDPIPAEPVTVESTRHLRFNRTGNHAFNRTMPAPTPETTPETTPEPTPEPTLYNYSPSIECI
jgi:hypothetical protein